MPNIKSAKKRVLITKKKSLNNQVQKSALKTAIKKAVVALSSSASKDEASVLLSQATKKIDVAASDRILHKNTAARKKSRLTKLFNSLPA